MSYQIETWIGVGMIAASGLMIALPLGYALVTDAITWWRSHG